MLRTTRVKILWFAVPVIALLSSFSIAYHAKKVKQFKTENVIILIIDGPRLSETFGDTSHQYIPNLSGVLAPQGVLFPNFRNNGPTYTNAGHTAIVTGYYERIKNNGLELPKRPSIFQYFLKEKGLDATHSWVIASKGKLDILTNTKDKEWKNNYRPSSYCGVDGKGTGFTADKFPWRDTKKLLTEHHPRLSLINLLEVDVNGHQNNWNGYLKGLRNTDQIALELWEFIQQDEIYKDKTTLFITNDHGRHLDGVKNGFINHGDKCEGCRRIYLVAIGPDFKPNTVIKEPYELIDISKTIAQMLHFSVPTSEGKVIKELVD